MKHQLSTDQEKFILANKELFTAEQMAVKQKLSVVEVKMFCDEQGITLPKKRSKPYYYLTGGRKRKIIVPKPEPAFERPPAQYGNLPSPMGIATKMLAGLDLL